MSSIKFYDIADVDSLISYLKASQRLSNIKMVNKYLKLSSVIDMFSSRMWLINNPANMNDLYEYGAFPNRKIWEKVCYMSFITQSTESMAMWSMYAQPWENGVMISVPVSALRNLIQNTKYLIAAEYDESTQRYAPTDNRISAENVLSLNRVAYFDGVTLTCTGRDDRNANFPEPYNISELAGYIKDSAWEYEKEVRLRVDLPDEYDCNAAYLELSDDFLSQIVITTGPRFSGNVLTSLPQKYRAPVKIKSSKFQEKLAWIPCDSCSWKKI